jgi:phosphatidylglycerol:prolipoprotein diacylglycerol transferase
MLPFPEINPNIVEIGPFKVPWLGLLHIKIRWYGLMYVLGFLASYFLISRQKKAKDLGLQGQTLQNLILFVALGLVVGARLGYVLFYQFANYGYYIRNPLEIVAVWHGGMSFHGGLLGAMLAGILFIRKNKLPVLTVADILIVTAPVGLAFGRLGNFINGELFGRPSSVPWAMVFPAGGPIARHPSQLYEAALEGIVLFSFLWFLKDRQFKPGTMVCLFLGGYGLLRFVVEFFREPDAHLGLFFGFISMGQILCLGMIAASIILWIFLPHNSVER